MTIAFVLWVLVGAAMWGDFVSSNWPKTISEWACDVTFALPFSIIFGPILLALRVIK